MGGVEVPQPPRGGKWGWVISLPTGGEGLWMGLCPLLRKVFVFFVENTIF